jgi:hypothetical protein
MFSYSGMTRLLDTAVAIMDAYETNTESFALPTLHERNSSSLQVLEHLQIRLYPIPSSRQVAHPYSSIGVDPNECIACFDWGVCMIAVRKSS